MILLAALLCLSLTVMATQKAEAAPYQGTCQNSPPLILSYYTEYGGPYYLCFWGSGYTGTYLQGVVSIETSWRANDGWLRVYDSSGGWFFNISYSHWYYFNSSILVTQICLDCGHHG
jgi:hypothetical protein